MRILLVGHSGSYNRGCEAIVRTTVDMLRKSFKNPEITISTVDYKREKLIDFGPGVKIIPAQFKNIWKRWRWQWALRQLYKYFFKKDHWKVPYYPLFSAIDKADVVLSVGGDNYSMDYGFPDYFIGLNRLVKERGKKLVIWGASVGPFPEGKNIRNIIRSLQLADLITAREPVTIDYLEKLGISAAVKRVSDPAFLLPLESVSLKDIFPDTTNDWVGVNVSPILSHYTDGKKDTYIIEEVSRFLAKLINDHDFHILLIPHVINSNNFNNDYGFMQKIQKRLQHTRKITAIPGNYNAMQTKFIISKCRFFIGARTHSTIAALSSGVPTLSLGYSSKSKGINRGIFGSYDFLLAVNNISTENLYEKFEHLHSQEEKVKKILAERIPVLKGLAWDNVRYLREVIMDGEKENVKDKHCYSHI